MKNILAIETSTRKVSVAIFANNSIEFDSDVNSENLDNLDLYSLVSSALSSAGLTPRDLTAVAVDVGPGGLNAVRAGVTFVNGLALSLSLPIIPLSSLAIMSYQARAATSLPVLCVRGATQDNACLAIYDGIADPMPIYGTIRVLADHVRSLATRYAVAGRFRHQLIQELNSKYFIDSAVDAPTACAMLAYINAKPSDACQFYAPIEIFYPEVSHR